MSAQYLRTRTTKREAIINDKTAIALAIHQCHGTPRQVRSGQAVEDRTIETVTAHSQWIPDSENGTEKGKQETSSETELRDMAVKDVHTIGMKAGRLMVQLRLANTRLQNTNQETTGRATTMILITTPEEGTITMFSLWKQPSAVHERASLRIQFPPPRSQYGASILL